MAKTISGRATIKILCKYFGFAVVSQKGSHVKLRSYDGPKTTTTVVPLHHELSTGTLKGVLKLGGVEEADFWLKAR